MVYWSVLAVLLRWSQKCSAAAADACRSLKGSLVIQANIFVLWCDPLGQITNFSSFDSDIRMCWIRGAGTDPCKLWKQLTNKHSGATTQAAHRTDFKCPRTIHWAIVRREHTLPAFFLYVSSLDHELMYPRFRKKIRKSTWSRWKSAYWKVRKLFANFSFVATKSCRIWITCPNGS